MITIKCFNANSPHDSQTVELTPETMINGECFIGRSPNCTIVCTSAEVSRVHGSISVINGQYHFTDLASRSGSRINNDPAEINHQYPLKQDDILRIGDFILIVEKVEVSPQETPSDRPVTAEKSPTNSESGKMLFPLPAIPQAAPEPARFPQGIRFAESPQEYMPVALIDPENISRWSKGTITVRCVRIVNETEDVKTFRFVTEPPSLFSYQPGQFMTLNLEIDGKAIKRSYSISSTPSRPHTLEITVKRVPAPPDQPNVPPGLVSNWLHDRLKVGDQIQVNGPSGKFTCFANPAQKLLFISAGSGITPMMSMSRWALDTAADLDIVFFHSARTPDDIIYPRELDLIASSHPKFRLAIAITRPQPGQSWSGFIGRLDEYMLYAIAPDFYQRTVYVCGPNPFMESTKALLERMNFPMENYYEESFGGAKKPKKAAEAPATQASVPAATPAPTPTPTPAATPAPAAATPAPTPAPSANSATLVFSKSGKEINCDPQTTILDIAEENGIELDSGCRSGACGACKVKKLSGQVNYESEPGGLDDSEQEEGYILTCIACPVGRVELVA